MALKNKVYIITGAARGIGNACAKEFAKEGAKVVVSDLDEAEGQSVADRIQAVGGDAAFIQCDVSDINANKAMVDKAIDIYGRLDGAIPNAGIVHLVDFVDLAIEDFDRVMNVNVRGAFVTAQAVAQKLIEQGQGGSIIHMSSINECVGIPNATSYAMSKGAISQLTKVMAIALAKDDIRVNAIGPGSINTDILKAVAHNKDAMHKVLSRTPMGRPGEPEEIARIAVFLASSDSSYITGQTIFADGGRLALNYTVPVD